MGGGLSHIKWGAIVLIEVFVSVEWDEVEMVEIPKSAAFERERIKICVYFTARSIHHL